MRATALLVRDAEGWFWVETDAQPRIEGLLVIDHIVTRGEAVNQARAQLAEFAQGQTQITVGIDPVDSQPLRDWRVGDSVWVDGAMRRVMAVTAQMDPDRPGRVTWVPQLGDIIESISVRTARAQKKMTNGTLGGTSKIASPLSGVPAAVPDCCAPRPVEPE